MTVQNDEGAGEAAPAVSDEAAGDPPPRNRSRATALSVFWALIVLGLVLAGFGNLGRPAPPPLEPPQVLDELFASAQVPPGFEATVARRLPGGETLLTLLPIEDAVDDVVELRLVRYPRARAKDVLEGQFQRLRFESADGGGWGRGRGGGGGDWGEDSGPKLQDAGTLTWHGYEARFARLRHTVDDGGERDSAGDGGASADGAASDVAGSNEPATAGGGGNRVPGQPRSDAYYDTVRINLTTADQCLVAYARFAQDTPGRVEDVGGLLDSFQPR
ncbi:MAG: hypothetical protein AAFU73_13230 [Planctomycetota bacterium]